MFTYLSPTDVVWKLIRHKGADIAKIHKEGYRYKARDGHYPPYVLYINGYVDSFVSEEVMAELVRNRKIVKVLDNEEQTMFQLNQEETLGWLLSE